MCQLFFAERLNNALRHGDSGLFWIAACGIDLYRCSVNPQKKNGWREVGSAKALAVIVVVPPEEKSSTLGVD